MNHGLSACEVVVYQTGQLGLLWVGLKPTSLLLIRRALYIHTFCWRRGHTCTLAPCVVPPQMVCKLLSQFPDQFYSQLLEWLSRLARNIKVHTYNNVCT